MCVHVNSLPDDCFYVIFDGVPLFALLHLDQVCHRWADLLPDACARRRTLALKHGILTNGGTFHIPFASAANVSTVDRYVYSELELDATIKLPHALSGVDYHLNDNLSHSPDEALDGLVQLFDPIPLNFTEMARFRHAFNDDQLGTYFGSLFPKVETFVMYYNGCDNEELGLIADLLSAASSTWSLKTVKLWLKTERDYVKEEGAYVFADPTALLQAINQLASLEHLTLDIDIQSGFGRNRTPNLALDVFAFIAKLKVLKLYIGHYDFPNGVWDIIHRFDSPTLRQIGLGSSGDFEDFNPFNEEHLTKYAFVNKVGHLYGIELQPDSVEDISLLCDRFISLTVLRMEWQRDIFHCNIPFSKFFAILAKLTKLTRLELSIQFDSFFECRKDVFDCIDEDDEDSKELQVVALPQVKILLLHLIEVTHQDFESLSPLVFPSVALVMLSLYGGCEICDANEGGGSNDEKEISCARLLIKSLRTKFGHGTVFRETGPRPHRDVDIFAEEAHANRE